MFYVEGTFYNDMRDAKAVDYSYPVRAFCHAHGLLPPPRPAPDDPAGRGAGPQATAAEAGGAGGPAYECAEMGDTTFEQLWLRLGSGAGYVYCHQASVSTVPAAKCGHAGGGAPHLHAQRGIWPHNP